MDNVSPDHLWHGSLAVVDRAPDLRYPQRTLFSSEPQLRDQLAAMLFHSGVRRLSNDHDLRKCCERSNASPICVHLLRTGVLKGCQPMIRSTYQG